MKYCELTLTWEKGRRLKSASNGSESVTYTYDAFGMRRSKTVGGSKTEYVYERGKLLREIRGSEKIDYLYGEEGIIGIKVGGEKYLYRKNVFGDVTEIYNEAGTLVGKYSYSAFGECEIEQDEGGIAEKNAIRYRGYYYDEETGFYYLKTRYYDPEIGRFITIDDTSYLAPDTINGLNLYAYCGNNPVMNVDPEGKFLISLLFTVLIGSTASALASMVGQWLTTGTIDWGQVGISALFGGLGSALSLIGVGGFVGQFLIQGVLGVTEIVALSAVDGSLSTLNVGDIITTFLFSGFMGSINAKGAAKEFKRINQVEQSLLKVLKREFGKGGFNGLKNAWANKAGKYLNIFIIPTLKSGGISLFINIFTNLGSYWIDKIYQKINN